MRISEQTRVAGLQLAIWHMSADPWGTNYPFDPSHYSQKSLPTRRKNMYHCLVRKMYKWDDQGQDWDIEAKAVRRGLTIRHKAREEDTSTADLINNNYA